MRKKRALLIAACLLPLMGAAALLTAFFAYQLGLDNNAAMGGGRKALATLGALLILIVPVWIVLSRLARRWDLTGRWANFRSRLADSRLNKWLDACGRGRLAVFLRRHAWIWVLAGGGLVFIISVWYLTAGTLTRWTPYTRYFDRQADAFLAGRLDLLEEPPAQFAAMDDLFDWRAREGIDYLWDASYYHGRYYLYWGPAPALAAAAIKLIHPGVVEDQALVLIFISGLALVMGALFGRLRKSYFPAAPGWTILLFTLTGVLCVPVFWLVNRPSVYEAAIASAQFFLILCLYALVRGAMENDPRSGWLALAGLSLGAAVASRSSYAPMAIFIAALVCLRLLKGLGKPGWRAAPLAGFALPLAMAACGLAWYNFARFGSIFETGLRYQLTGDALPLDRGMLFSLGYLAPNAYSALIRPLDTTRWFPFFSTPYILDNMWPNFIRRPTTYYSGEQVAGVLATIPFLWLLAVPLVNAVRAGLDWINEKTSTPTPSRLPAWGWGLIACAALIQLLTSLAFVMTTMRYLADFTPLLILLAALLAYAVYERLKNRPGLRRLFSAAVLLLCTASIAVGLLTNMQGADKRFETNNPRLYSELVNTFSPGP